MMCSYTRPRPRGSKETSTPRRVLKAGAFHQASVWTFSLVALRKTRRLFLAGARHSEIQVRPRARSHKSMRQETSYKLWGGCSFPDSHTTCTTPHLTLCGLLARCLAYTSRHCARLSLTAALVLSSLRYSFFPHLPTPSDPVSAYLLI